MIWYIAVYILIWCNQDITSNVNCSDDCCIYTNPYIITDNRSPLSPPTIFLTYRYTFVYINIFSEYSTWINCNTIWMTKIQTRTYICFNIQVNMVSIFKIPEYSFVYFF